MFFEAEGHISKSRAAVQRKEASENGKDKSSPPGRYFIPVPKTRGGAPLPTFRAWQEEQAKKKSPEKENRSTKWG